MFYTVMLRVTHRGEHGNRHSYEYLTVDNASGDDAAEAAIASYHADHEGEAINVAALKVEQATAEAIALVTPKTEVMPEITPDAAPVNKKAPSTGTTSEVK